IVGRCNNMAVLPNIPCLKECRIVGKLLVGHAISHALTATADVLAVYIQQFWKTVRQLPVETPEQPFIPPADFDYIKPFLMILGYQGSLDKKKNVIQYPRFTKLIIADLIEKFESIPKRLKEDYYTIKDDTSLMNVYTSGKVTVRGMLIPDDLLTNAIRDTQAYDDYEAK
ncbi:hypothetical protein Tco_1432962, partial [Tanacetum coccineum]